MNCPYAQHMTTIRFEHVTKFFPGAPRPAVDDVSLEVESGRLIVLLGPSGCGKTTLLKMVNRLIEPTAGTIYLDGEDIRQIELTALRRQIGYVIQQIGLFPHMTVAQNIAVVPELLGWSRQQTDRRIDELLDLIGLPPQEYRHRYPAQLSGGQQQRVGLARALAGDPRLMLMDEPFGAIDAITRASLQEAMLQLKRKLSKTVLFVTHDVEEALRLADKIVVLREGRVVQYDTPFTILTQPANEFVYDLIGAEDMVRRLGMLRVESAMQRATPVPSLNGAPTIGLYEDLHHALSLLLRTGAPALTVVDASQPVGMLSLDDIRASTSERKTT